MRSLELFLLHPLPDSAASARFQGVGRLLSRARKSAYPQDSLEGALMQAFAVSRQRDWPVAPLARLGDGEMPDSGYWICADPVHLQVDRDALILAAPGYGELGQSDAHAVVQTLNGHFETAGIQFFAPAPTRWYARCAQAPVIETVPLREAAGRDVDTLLPRGDDALAWHRIFNEIQMLLHNHPVNEAREDAGLPAINSVWFWGGGTLPSQVSGKWSFVWAGDALAKGLARAAGIAVDDVPRDLLQWGSRAHDGAHLVVLGDADVQRTGTDWLAPALQALRLRSLDKLSVSAPLGSAVRRFDLSRSDLWKFWRSAAA
jgi:hypothetical protein